MPSTNLQTETETAASLTTLAPLSRALDAILQAAVRAEIDRYGSLENAILGLHNDACGARPDAPVHSIYQAALKLRSEQRELADPSLKVRRLRLNAIAFRYSHQQNMDEYGREIGRAWDLLNKGESITAALVKSAANACLDLASEYLTQAIEAEREADEIESGGFFTLFDGVSVRRSEQRVG